MSVNIYIDSFGGNYIGAVADESGLVEYRLEKKNRTVTIGSIFKGRVENVLGGMQAAFVNVGLGRNGYLSADDMLMDRAELEGKIEVPSILDLEEGQEIMVQAVKDPAGTKGVRLTSNISFAGRYVVFMPTLAFVGVSRKITDGKLRLKLEKIAEDVRPEGAGVIIRTAGAEASKADIRRELNFLVKQYAAIEQAYKESKAPSCIYEEGNIAFRMIRDVFGPQTDKFIVSDKELYDSIYEYAVRADAELKNKLYFFNKKVDMFRYYGLEPDVDALLGRRAELDNGGYLIIDKTEALTVIDVNTGSFVGSESLEKTVYETNMLAADEIARQLRLRNISGIIVVDFIDMADEDHRLRLLDALDRALSEDREKCNVIGMTGLGLVELTRKKKRRESVSMLLKPCPYCQGVGSIQSNDYIVAKIRAELLDLFADGYDNAIIDLNVEIAEYILAKKDLKKDIDKLYKNKRIYIVPHKTYHQQFFIVKGDNNTVLDVSDKAILLY